MLNLLVKEYLAICEYLLELEKRRQETEELPLVRKGQLLVDKDMLTMLLDKNKYETATNKLKYWKDLAHAGSCKVIFWEKTADEKNLY